MKTTPGGMARLSAMRKLNILKLKYASQFYIYKCLHSFSKPSCILADFVSVVELLIDREISAETSWISHF